MRADVVVVGSYNRDYAWHVDRTPAAGETRRSDRFRTAAGGKGFNQAVACARQGAATAFVGALGDDASGRDARALAAAEGLDARWQVCRDAATGSACILVEAGGQNRIVVALGANEHLDPAFVRRQGDAFAQARVVLVQLESPVAAVRAALEMGVAPERLCLLNPAPMHADFDTALLPLCDVLTPNETEFASLLGRVAGDRIDAAGLVSLGDAELHALARKLDVATLVVTLGAEGCFVSHARADRRGDDAAFYRIAAEKVRAIDTTGAGDAFSGALAAACVRMAARPFREAVLHANRAAALSTERAGAAASMPSCDEVIARFAQRA
ncbi:MAG TPA: ribokinase [Dokdonella sp.]